MTHKRWFFLMLGMAIVLTFVGAYLSPRVFLGVLFCIGWAIHHIVKWFSGAPSKSIVEETREAFGKFYDNTK
jgi:hypothetical protein